MVRRILLVLVSLVVLVAVVAGGALAWLVWRPETIKGPLERLVSDLLGQPFRIEGGLVIDPGRVTVVEAEGLVVGAPEWAQSPHLAKLQRVRVGVDLGAYLGDRTLRITELRLDKPELALERGADGRTSWPSGGEPQEQPSEQPTGRQQPTAPSFPAIEALTVTDGRVTYRDAVTDVEVATAFTTAARAGQGTGEFAGLKLDGEGRVRDERVRFALEVGSPLLLRTADTPFPIKGSLTGAGSNVQVNGQVREPLRLAGLDLSLELASDDPRQLLALVGRNVTEPVPALSASARVTRPEAAFAVDGLSVGWGASRLEGVLRFDPSGPRPKLEGQLRAPVLDLVALQPVLDAESPQAEESTGPSPLMAYDARVDLAADRVVLPQTELREVTAGVQLAQGRLQLDPLRASLPEGRLSGRLATVPLDQPLVAEVGLQAENVTVTPFLGGRTDIDAVVTGELGGTVRGRTPAEIMAQSALVFDGRIRDIRYPGVAVRQVTGQAKLEGGVLTLDPIRAELPEQGTLAGRVALSGTFQPPFTAELAVTGERVDVATLIPGDAGVGGILTGDLSGTVHGLTLPEIVQRSRLAFDGRVERVKLPNVPVQKLTGQVRLQDGRLTLEPLRADLVQGGHLTGRVTLAGIPERPLAADVAVKGERLDIATLVGRDIGVHGLFTGELIGDLQGADVAEIVARSRLRLIGDLTDLRLPQLEDRLPKASVTATLSPQDKQPLRLVLEGPIGGAPFKLEAHGGAPAAFLLGEQGGYPLAVVLAVGETRAGAEGTVGLPLTSERMDLDLRIEGPDPAKALVPFGLPEIELPPYRLAGHMARRGNSWRLTRLDGRIGDTDVGGELALALGGARPKVSGKLHSRQLDLDDLGGLVGAEPGDRPGETASGEQRAEAQAKKQDDQVLPDEPIEPSRWQNLDVDLALAADKVAAGRVPFDAFDVRVVMDAGRLRVEPLVLRLGDGQIEGKVAYDTRRRPAVADLDLDLRRLPVARLLNRLDVETSSFGTLSGRARGGVGVEGAGFSVAQVLSNADGELTLLMEGGTINRRIVSALGFDLLRLLGGLLGGGQEQIDLRCTLADFLLKDGVMQTRSLVIDTPVADIAGEGTIDLRNETIDIELIARPESAPLPSGRTGIRIGGTFAEPAIDLSAGRLLARGAAAATFGVLLRPFAALGSALGGARETQSACAALLAQTGGGAVDGGGAGGGAERPAAQSRR